MADVAKEILAAYKPRTQTATVCVDGELFAALNRLAGQVLAEGDGKVSEADEAEVEALLTRAEACTYHFRFQAVGAARWRTLKRECGPTDKQVQAARARGLDPLDTAESFWHHALPECLVAIKKATDGDDAWQAVDWDADRLAEFTAGWNAAQYAELVAACQIANEQGNTLPRPGRGYLRELAGRGAE